MELAIVSDTHIPSRAPDIPDWVRDRVRNADHTIHAGDFVSGEAYEMFETLTDGNLTAVQGNMDTLPHDLSPVETLDLERVTFVVTHGTGSPAGYHDRVTSIIREHAGDDAVGIAGHTHQPEDTVIDGIRLLNPGSATGAPPAPGVSMMTAEVTAGHLEVTLNER